jgi:hypothetical protein
VKVVPVLMMKSDLIMNVFLVKTTEPVEVLDMVYKKKKSRRMPRFSARIARWKDEAGKV